MIPTIALALLAGHQDEPADPPTPAAHPLAAAAEPADDLIAEGETRFERLWKLTSGGENAEGYFGFGMDRLVLQRRNQAEGIDCDRIFLLEPESDELVPVSDGTGVTTCAYFLPGDREVLYASTRDGMEGCPPPPDFSQGYVWSLHAEHDLWVRELATGELRRLTDEPGYDAEATVSPLGDRIVFTSVRSGDLELWTAALDGTDLVQVTDTPGYDGGAFFSHDGERLVFRATAFGEDREAELADYRALLAEDRVRPSAMELFVIDADGSDRVQISDLGGANFAPYFFPDDRRVIFSSNHHDEGGRGRDFDLFAIGVAGGELERVTHYDGFDSFPMFSADGRWLVFASNRGAAVQGETNLFLAEWR